MAAVDRRSDSGPLDLSPQTNGAAQKRPDRLGGQLDAFAAAVRDGVIDDMAVIDAVYRAAGMEPRPARTG